MIVKFNRFLAVFNRLSTILGQMRVKISPAKMVDLRQLRTDIRDNEFHWFQRND